MRKDILANVIEYENDIVPKDKYLINLICIQLLGGAIQAVLRYISFRIFGSSNYGTYAFVIFISVMILRYIIKNPKDCITSKGIVLIILYSGIIGFSYLAFTHSREYITRYMPDLMETTVVGMFCAVIISRISNFRYLAQVMKKYLRVTTPLMLIVYIIGGYTYFGSMSWGIRITPLALIYYLIIKYSDVILYDRIMFAVAMVLSLLGGRQSLIIVFGSIIVCTVYNSFSEKSNRKKYIKITALILFGLLFIALYDIIIDGTLNFLESHGMTSRSLLMLSKDRLLDDSNRGGIYNICWEYIDESGIKISGLYTDRYYLSTRGFKDGYFAHNIFLELLMDFGTLLGSIIILWFVLKALNCIIQTRKDFKLVTIVIISIGMLRFFVSGSIITSSMFWIAIGYCSNKSIRKKNKGGALSGKQKCSFAAS